jgi:hypothetical protein
LDQSQLIEVGHNIFLSKTDPDFHQKYLKYYPDNVESLYKYGNRCIEEGRELKGWKLIEKAASLDYLPAKQQLDALLPERVVPLPKKRLISNNVLTVIAIVLSTIIVLLLLLVVWSLLSRDHIVNSKTEQHTVYERTVNNSVEDIKTIFPQNEQTTKEILPALVIQNATERYKEREGNYPLSESDFLKPAPDNVISFMPEGVRYSKNGNGYSIVSEGKGSDLFIEGLLSLHFYPNTNQLTLQRGNEVLVSYSVASGKSEFPPSKSQVTVRAIEPKGKNGVYGSRGLALTENFAIHGTNNPETIGQKVTDGCLRLANKDIESLYPYVSLGTPFIVEETNSKPKIATFIEGLPSLPIKSSLASIEKTNTIYNWKN